MTFADLVPGESVFLDANIFLLHFEPHAALGPPCTDLLKRIELQEYSAWRFQKIPQLRVQILAIPADMFDTAAGNSQQFGLLTNDAVIIAVMQANGLTKLASHDADFDRVPGITRYAPV